ncbi:MAG TPA: LptE family protein [Candidatus Angelobacter sp.]|nr:LptE family protein [Candidatus Angelobacter sp.]
MRTLHDGDTETWRKTKNRPFDFSILALLAIMAMALGCGYHTAGHAVRLPESMRSIAIPGFTNQTQTYRIEQILTRDVVREFIGRTHYQVLNSSSDSADATLKGVVVSTLAAPLTYDAQTGRASSAIITVTMKVSLVDRGGRVLFENQNYTFREQYQVSREIASFFEEETPALQRMARDFARTLVSDILEGY